MYQSKQYHNDTLLMKHLFQHFSVSAEMLQKPLNLLLFTTLSAQPYLFVRRCGRTSKRFLPGQVAWRFFNQNTASVFSIFLSFVDRFLFDCTAVWCNIINKCQQDIVLPSATMEPLTLLKCIHNSY